MQLAFPELARQCLVSLPPVFHILNAVLVVISSHSLLLKIENQMCHRATVGARHTSIHLITPLLLLAHFKTTKAKTSLLTPI